MRLAACLLLLATAWKSGIVEGTDVYSGRYGETSYGVRLVHYADWIEAVTADRAPPPR